MAKTDVTPEEIKVDAMETKPVVELETAAKKSEENEEEPMEVDSTEPLQEAAVDKPEDTKSTPAGTCNYVFFTS